MVPSSLPDFHDIPFDGGFPIIDAWKHQRMEDSPGRGGERIRPVSASYVVPFLLNITR